MGEFLIGSTIFVIGIWVFSAKEDFVRNLKFCLRLIAIIAIIIAIGTTCYLLHAPEQFYMPMIGIGGWFLLKLVFRKAGVATAETPQVIAQPEETTTALAPTVFQSVPDHPIVADRDERGRIEPYLE